MRLVIPLNLGGFVYLNKKRGWRNVSICIYHVAIYKSEDMYTQIGGTNFQTLIYCRVDYYHTVYMLSKMYVSLSGQNFLWNYNETSVSTRKKKTLIFTLVHTVANLESYINTSPSFSLMVSITQLLPSSMQARACGQNNKPAWGGGHLFVRGHQRNKKPLLIQNTHTHTHTHTHTL